MKVVSYEDVTRFRDRAMPLLMRDECANCVLIGIIQRLIEGKSPTRSGRPTVPLLLMAEDRDQPVGVAMQTPPHALLFSPLDEPAAHAIVEFLHEQHWPGSEFSGTVPSVRSLACRWSELTSRQQRVHRSLKLFRTDRIIAPRATSGSLRPATLDDMSVATQWIETFGLEIREPFPDPARTAQISIEEGRLQMWDDEQARSICAWQGPTPNSVRIGLVYTPPEFRGRGYASNAVAELTREQLESGRKFCTLFTDAGNATSNSIYQKMGYEFIAQFEHVKFQ